ncbi:MAG: hypothetical protein JXN65_12010 [Clostridia bacterium]|nr:hypothetical protein [Clostridia bacterium]
MDFKIKNFSIEKFNIDVNSSGNPQSKYAGWQSYRADVARFISDNINNGETNSLFVFGAGECNDIDLAFLASVFDSVVLSDIDLFSITDGITRQQLDKDKEAKLSKQRLDYSGLEEARFFENLSKMASRKADEKEIVKYIKNIISSFEKIEIRTYKKDTYDTVIVLPTYTQIAFTQMEALLRILYDYGIYPLDALNGILNEMYNIMPAIIERYNKLILSKVKSGGKVIVLTDILEITDFSLAERMKESIENKQYIKDYLKENYSELALLGLDNIKQSLDITSERYCIWPFDDRRQYLVIFTAGNKI